MSYQLYWKKDKPVESMSLSEIESFNEEQKRKVQGKYEKELAKKEANQN